MPSGRRATCRLKPLHLYNLAGFLKGWLNGDRTGPLGESGGPSTRKGGESDVESWHLQGCSSSLCRLRTDGLVPMSKY
jgi:hypothetical protein